MKTLGILGGAVLVGAAAISSGPAAAWKGDLGDGTYRNPVLYADYSDPDVIRVGSDYYLVASSFHYVPALPILHSKDLVNWTIAGHVTPRLDIEPRYNLQGGNRYGRGVWAPTLRHHAGRFFVYFCTPDEGLFVSTAPAVAGPWTPLHQVKAVEGWEDPSPLWDDDGQAYIMRSRLQGGPLILHRMSADGRTLLDEGKTVFEDTQNLPILEGPKFMKRDGQYYIFAPAFGVSRGPQVVFRASKPFGPYDYRIVLRGLPPIEGPHQGGYVETPSGEGWFLHFNLTRPHGRILHMQPVRWRDGWPVMGDEGFPVAHHRKPDIPGPHPITEPATSDEFNGAPLGLQWQWNHNPVDANWSLTARPGHLSLTAGRATTIFSATNTLTQTLTDPDITYTTLLRSEQMIDGQHAGLALLWVKAAELAVVQRGGAREIDVLVEGRVIVRGPKLPPGGATPVELRARVSGMTVAFSYRLPHGRFTPIGDSQPIDYDTKWWKGARPALFSYNVDRAGGRADFDYLRAEPAAAPTAGRKPAGKPRALK